jgi:hypothetical protein
VYQQPLISSQATTFDILPIHPFKVNKILHLINKY